MKKKNAFEKKYPQFVKYITDDVIQRNMLDNKDLQKRYDSNSESIKIFLQELDKHFDIDTIREILSETIFKYPDELLKAFISAYLNSTEAVKSNPLVVTFFNKTVYLGVECLKYIEECGIIANREYKNLPTIAINHSYHKVRKGNEYYKGQKLDELFYSLSYSSKRLVLKLITTSSFNVLDVVFEKFSYSLNTILELLISRNIDEKILDKSVLNTLGDENMMLYICMILDSDMYLLIINHLKNLIDTNRVLLIKSLVEKNLLSELYRMTDEEIINKSDNEIIIELTGKNINLAKRDE